MEGILYQWDKACDAMPVLRPAATLILIISVLYFVFRVLPAAIMPENENRPMPNMSTVFDSLTGEYVAAEGNRNPKDVYQPVEGDKITALLTPPPTPKKANEVDENIVHAEIEGGIGRSVDTVLGEEVWDYQVEVSYLVDSSYGRKKLKLDSGVFVDTRDLRLISEHTQSVTLDPPTKAGANLVNFPVKVKTMRDIVTGCAYYSMFLYGEERLVIAGSELHSPGALC